MASVATFSGGLKVQQIHTAKDGTRKILSRVEGGRDYALVETVMMSSSTHVVFSIVTLCATH
jgi:hypothetical protein